MLRNKLTRKHMHTTSTPDTNWYLQKLKVKKELFTLRKIEFHLFKIYLLLIKDFLFFLYFLFFYI